MATYAFSFCSVTLTTNLLTGQATASIKIPGTFSGAVPSDSTNTGRFLRSVSIWSASAVDGDAVTSIKLVDNDGVVPLAARAAFPSYPVIIDLLDTVTGADSKLLIPPAGITAEAFNTIGEVESRFLPSGLYLEYEVTAGAPAIRLFRSNIRWGKWF